MAEVTYVGNISVGTLLGGSSKGTKLIGLCMTVSDGETLSTPLRTIHGIGHSEVEATDIDAATNQVWVKTVSAGVITFVASEIATYGNATDVVCYILIMGST